MPVLSASPEAWTGSLGDRGWAQRLCWRQGQNSTEELRPPGSQGCGSRAGEHSEKGACGESEAQKLERSMAGAGSRGGAGFRGRGLVSSERQVRPRKSEKVLDGRGMESRQCPGEGGKGGWKAAGGLHLWTHEAVPRHLQPCPCPCPCPRPLGAICVQGLPWGGAVGGRGQSPTSSSRWKMS